MKSFNLLLVMLVLFTACAPDTSPPSAAEQLNENPQNPQEALIILLDQKKQAIDQQLARAELRHDSLSFECEQTREGGRLSFFREGDEVRLLRYAYYNGDHQGGIINAYVEEEQVFYAHVEEMNWSFDQEAPQDDGTLHTREDYSHYTYYYDATGGGIRCLQKDYIVRSAVELPTEVEKIKANEIGCGGAQLVQALFSQVKKIETISDLMKVFCTED